MIPDYHLITLADTPWTSARIAALLERAAEIKRRPEAYRSALAGRTLLMLFEKPSLRTRVSFETGMTQLGGHAIFYSIADSPLGKKETFADTGAVLSRYCDLVMARLFKHSDLAELARAATVPVINGLTDFTHPCQILADLLTLQERKGPLAGKKLAYLGDGNNNVTHSLLYGCARTGVSIGVACPEGAAYSPQPAVVETARKLARETKSRIEVAHDPVPILAGADAVYTDTWMSYHIPKAEEAARLAALRPFQVTRARMAEAAPGAIFLHCLPAQRGMEMTAEVIDGPQSVVFDEAENRLHVQKALMIELVERAGKSRS